MSSSADGGPKRCLGCGQTKPSTAFYANHARRDGRADRCKKCVQAYLASYRESLRNRTDPPGRCIQGHQMRREPSGRPVCDICKSNRRKEARESDAASAERERLRMRQHRARWRDEALSILGRACVCCGQTRQVFLHIDHTNNDGHEHRRTAGIRGGAAMNRWVIAHPAEARQRCQVLCANCNMAKAIEENHTCPPGE